MINKLLIFLLLIQTLTYSQVDGLDLCRSYKSKSFTYDKEANETLDKILSVIGASKRFVLLPCDNINNAVADIYKGVRYIFYNKNFMREVYKNTNDWANLAILAHEVGHHINGHTLINVSLKENRLMELEADEFAGFVMAELGASLNQALSFTEIFVEFDDTYETHPNKSKRINAVKRGYAKSKVSQYKYEKTNLQSSSAEEYFNTGVEYFKNKKYGEAIGYYSIALEINPEFIDALKNRGLAKTKINDWSGASKDFDKLVKLSPKSYNFYILKSVASNANRNNGEIRNWTYLECIDINESYKIAVKASFEDARGIRNDFTECF